VNGFPRVKSEGAALLRDLCLAFLFVFAILCLPRACGGDLDEEQAAADHTAETVAAARQAHLARIREAKAEFARRRYAARVKEDASKMLYPLAQAK